MPLNLITNPTIDQVVGLPPNANLGFIDVVYQLMSLNGSSGNLSNILAVLEDIRDQNTQMIGYQSSIDYNQYIQVNSQAGTYILRTQRLTSGNNQIDVNRADNTQPARSEFILKVDANAGSTGVLKIYGRPYADGDFVQMIGENLTTGVKNSFDIPISGASMHRFNIRGMAQILVEPSVLSTSYSYSYSMTYDI
jgi:hypothetical protein